MLKLYLTNRFYYVTRLIFILIGLITFLNDYAYASEDHPQWRKETDFGQPLFVISTHQRLGLDPALIRLDIVVEVVNDMLMFIREDDEFVASLDLHLSIMHAKENRIINQIKHINRTVSEYKLTNSKRDYTTETFTAELKPGKYTVKIMLEDKESKLRESVEKKIVIAPKTTKAGNAISDIILARSNEVDNETGIPFQPTVSGMIPYPTSPLYCHFDLMQSNLNGDCDIELKVVEKSGKVRYCNNSKITSTKVIESYYLPVFCENLTFNKYKLIIQAVIGSDTLQSKASFSINFHGLPWVIKDIDQAIQYMRYIAKPEEITRLANELTSRKEETFLKFWNDNFPCPEGAINPKMVEYYSRINFANANLSSNREGWETDRGRIIVIYGRPTEIEKRTNENNTVEYEIWYYSHLNRQFVFVDDFGFGEYRLTMPDW
ncbi:GWxTD domain-containing protein [bacterium]|nr:GWxTD domain-containing protein [bacterium]